MRLCILWNLVVPVTMMIKLFIAFIAAAVSGSGWYRFVFSSSLLALQLLLAVKYGGRARALIDV